MRILGLLVLPAVGEWEPAALWCCYHLGSNITLFYEYINIIFEKFAFWGRRIAVTKSWKKFPMLSLQWPAVVFHAEPVSVARSARGPSASSAAAPTLVGGSALVVSSPGHKCFLWWSFSSPQVLSEVLRVKVI